MNYIFTNKTYSLSLSLSLALLFYYTNHVILFVYRILYVTTCHYIVGSCGYRTKEPAKVPGGWSIATPSRVNPPVVGKSRLSAICLSFCFLFLLTSNCQEYRIVFVAQSYYYGEYRQSRETTWPLEEDRRGSEERRAAGRANIQSQQQRRRRSGSVSG